MILSFIIFVSTSYSQIGELHGLIYGVDAEGKKEKLANATVFWLGTQTGTFSDKSGHFVLKRESNSDRLVVRFVGYRPDTILIAKEQSFVEVILKAEFTTDEIKVTGRQDATIISSLDPVKTEVITTRGLQKAACCNLSESFQTNPTVDVSYNDAITGAKQIKLLGLEGSYTQMLIERIPNLRGLASTFGLNYIPGTWMESISISKGAASVLDGYESITGQINVEYKKPENLLPALFNGYYDNSSRFELNIDDAYEISQNLWTGIFGHFGILQSTIDRNHDGFMDKPKTTQLNLMNRWKYDNGSNESITMVKALYENRKGGQRNFFELKDSRFFGFQVETQRFEFFTKNGFFLNPEIQQTIGTMVSATYHKQNAFFGRNNYDGNQKNAYINLIFQSELMNNETSDFDIFLSSGASLLYDNYNERFNDTLLRREEIVPGLFTELNFNLFKNFILITGIRVDFHNLFGVFYTPRIHLKYSFDEFNVIRASFGKGYHITNIFAENVGLMSSSRNFIIQENLKPESAWNYGFNFGTKLDFLGIPVFVNGEFYRTDFENQVIIDTDLNTQEVNIYNLSGNSYSNSFQIDISFEPIECIVITTAYRINDVKYTLKNNDLVEKPLISPHKAFINIAYSIGNDDWLFDLTTEYNSSGRLPNTSNNPDKYRLKDRFPAYVLMHSQITKKFGKLDVYLGGENLLDFKQANPILAYEEPFSNFFDGSIIWGPIMGRLIYLGFRYNF